jgi:predicted porin
MQKKIVALAVAGLSTAAFAQTNVTIYGVADLSGQGFTASQSKARTDASGSVFGIQSNSSLMGFKGTEDLGNGLKAMFQAETGLDLAGNQAGNSGSAAAAYGSSNGLFSTGLRDTYVGLNSKYGTGLVGYLSTPLRSSLTSFDVMPGATGSSQIDKQMSAMRFGATGASFSTSIRATAIAYAMPTLYGFDASIAYTGSNNNGTDNSTAAANCSNAQLSACSATPQSAWGLNLGWTGYGVNIKGAFQQNNNQLKSNTTPAVPSAIGDYTSYLVGAMYTGIQGLKLSGVYVRNTLGTNGQSLLTTNGAGKLTNNQWWMGTSYRMGNWEPAVSASFSSDVDGSSYQQLGSRQWTARVGYYLSKRTQAYGLISNLNNSANQNFDFGQQTAKMGTGAAGMNLFTYGMGMRTTF